MPFDDEQNWRFGWVYRSLTHRLTERLWKIELLSYWEVGVELSIVLRVLNTILVESDIGLNNEILSFPSFSEILCYLLFSHLSLKRICRNISQKGISSQMTLLFLPPKGKVMTMKEMMYCVYINRVEGSQTVIKWICKWFWCFMVIFFGNIGIFQ